MSYNNNKLLKKQLIPYFEYKKLEDLTRSEIKKWIIWASEKWSAKTVNNAQSVLLTVAEIKDIYFSSKWHLGNFPGYLGKYSQRIFGVMK